MARPLVIEPLTKAAFAPFGTIIEADPSSVRLINGGTTERFHALARADVVGDGASVIINLFRGQPRSFPYVVDMVERHPLGSQSFSPLSGHNWLAVVAPDEDGRPGVPRVFRVSGSRGLNYGRNVWHHPLIAVGAVCDFLVVDREGPGNNLVEFFYEEPFVIESAGNSDGASKP
ncbi:ureidoglycolate lyase [Pararhizobium capsulatum DSM 1112]|uniref:Ureidoglycolate lyase n=1 Tax=Pararhizobium capsulatum DSM 1112 TaxID=1121113 RepID=A0ABU0BTM2_9HYPH|nr:ureidoglycolate lyase [Pararhizobium capsulatum]MDQ0321308.1 ureidoglycolate lyase [Pararhizobium capsulatum DSM 1112]